MPTFSSIESMWGGWKMCFATQFFVFRYIDTDVKSFFIFLFFCDCSGQRHGVVQHIKGAFQLGKARAFSEIGHFNDSRYFMWVFHVVVRKIKFHFWGYKSSVWLYCDFFPSFNSSICDATFFGSAIRERHPWIRSIFQLSNNAISDRTRFLQFSQLVRRSSMVSVRSYHRRNNLSRLDGNIGRIVPFLMAAEHYRRHP